MVQAHALDNMKPSVLPAAPWLQSSGSTLVALPLGISPRSHLFSPCCPPLLQVSSDETERLVKMEEVLHSRVIGQEEAVTAISRAIRRARVGLKNPNRPIASFIFSGAPGAGRAAASLLELAVTLRLPCLLPETSFAALGRGHAAP